MGPGEFEAWIAFYKLFPFDDLHRFHRPAAMVAHAFGGDYEKRLAFLAPDPVPEGMSESDVNTIRAMRALGVGKKD